MLDPPCQCGCCCCCCCCRSCACFVCSQLSGDCCELLLQLLQLRVVPAQSVTNFLIGSEGEGARVTIDDSAVFDVPGAIGVSGAGVRKKREWVIISRSFALEGVHCLFKAGIAGADASNHERAAIATKRVLQNTRQLAVAVPASHVSKTKDICGCNFRC
jgi:hypothetical protein